MTIDGEVRRLVGMDMHGRRGGRNLFRSIRSVVSAGSRRPMWIISFRAREGAARTIVISSRSASSIINKRPQGSAVAINRRARRRQRQVSFDVRIARVCIEPGDTLVFMCEQAVSAQMYQRFTEHAERVFPGVKCILLDHGLKLGVLRQRQESHDRG